MIASDLTSVTKNLPSIQLQTAFEKSFGNFMSHGMIVKLCEELMAYSSISSDRLLRGNINLHWPIYQ